MTGEFRSTWLTHDTAQARRDVHLWLRHVPGERYRDSLQRRLEGTGLWILQEERFLQWKSPVFASDAKILWVHGPAGFGKTILCATMVQHLTAELGTPTAHFFFSSETESRDDPFFAVRSWISQVISCNDAAFRLALQRQESDNDPASTRHAIMAIFEDLVRLIPGCTFVLDGLDECTLIDGGAQNSALTFLGAVMNAIAGTETRLLVVSRFLAGIQHAMQGEHPSKLSEIKLRPHDVQADIVAYARDVVDKKLQNKPAALRTSLSDTMAERCEGQFLWIRLQGESLRRGMSKKQLQETVEDTPNDLDNIYNHSWTMITRLKDADRNRAFSLLRWAVFAARPLIINEVAEAILVEESHEYDFTDLCDDLDSDYVDTEVVGLCGSLLEVNMDAEPTVPSYWTLHLPHFTVREFLVSRLPTPGWILSSNLNLQPSPEMLHHALLAEICLRYISLPGVWTPPLTPDSYVDGTSFRNYATSAWHHHAILGVPNDPTLMELAREFFNLDNPSWVAWRTLQVAMEAQQVAEESTETTDEEPTETKDESTETTDKESTESTDEESTDTADDVAKETTRSLKRPIEYALYLGMPDFAVSLLRSPGCSPEDLDATVQSAFRYVCSYGPTSVLEAMIEQGANATSIGDDGWSPLHFVAGGGHIDAARILLANNADAKALTKIGSPLHQAAGSGSVDMVKLLLSHGADVNAATGSTAISPLQRAAVKGHTHIMTALIERGADIDSSDHYGDTALMEAVVHGQQEAVSLLLEHGANVNLADTDGSTPAHQAVNAGNLRILEAILEHGASIDATSSDGQTPLHLAAEKGDVAMMTRLISRGAQINARDQTGADPIYLAAEEGHVEATKLLLDLGASANSTTDDAGPVLGQVTVKDHLEVANLLLECGADAGAKYGKPGWTMLSCAAICGHLAMAKLLLKHGADHKTINPGGSTPLGLAAKHGFPEVIEVLLKHKADINAVDGSGFTPLSYASMFGNMSAVEMLLRHGADSSAFNIDRSTPLTVAIEQDHIGIFSLLLEHNADPNIYNLLGRSPLFSASRAGRLSIVRTLLEAGAEQHVKDWKGWTPLSAAVHCDHPGVATLLQNFKAGTDGRGKALRNKVDLAAVAGTEEEPDTSPSFCDSCLSDMPSDGGHACASMSCRDIAFLLCARCFDAKTGCPDPTHEFWPKDGSKVESVEEGEALANQMSTMEVL